MTRAKRAGAKIHNICEVERSFQAATVALVASFLLGQSWFQDSDPVAEAMMWTEFNAPIHSVLLRFTSRAIYYETQLRPIIPWLRKAVLLLSVSGTPPNEREDELTLPLNAEDVTEVIASLVRHMHNEAFTWCRSNGSRGCNRKRVRRTSTSLPWLMVAALPAKMQDSSLIPWFQEAVPLIGLQGKQ